MNNAPDKPWESYPRFLDKGVNRLQGSGRVNLNSNSPQLVPKLTLPMRNAELPPVPPRPPQLSTPTHNRLMYGPTPSMYGGYGGYSSYGSYPGHMYNGGYPGSYAFGSYGTPNSTSQSRFMHAAEESSRSAFQSIESLVRAFTSVSMMLESTYHAMYSSFQAILGVVDNFSRLRQLFSHFISAITFLRLIKNFYRRLLYWLGAIKEDPRSEQIWNSVTEGGTVTSRTNSSSWPLFTFLGLLFGGPYLISKFFSPKETEKWDLRNGKLYEAAYPYDAASTSELSFRQHELINVAPPEFQLQNGGGWLLAANTKRQVGYVPSTRLGSRVISSNINSSISTSAGGEVSTPVHPKS